MFKIGDKVQDIECPGQGTETVKEIKQVWVIRTNEWPSLELPAERFELVKPRFPRDGARVQDKHTGETGTISPVGFNRGWYVTTVHGVIEVPEGYLLAHFEEAGTFPYEGARWRRKGAPSDTGCNHGTIVEQQGQNFLVSYGDGSEARLSARFIEDEFEEGI